MLPKVTVLTSCYNAARYLPEAIESILGQTFKDFEFLLIDDGSTDETLEIIRQYAAQDDRILVVEKKNSGLADSLNKGIKVAVGQWIARLDADDIAFLYRLERQYDYVQKDPGIVLIGSGCITIDQRGREIKCYKYPSRSKPFSPFPHSTAFYRTDAVRQLGGYRPRIYRAEDKDLWLRLSSCGKIGCLREPLIKLRKHSESITATDEKCAISSYAAMVSFLLVQEGEPDPVEQSDEAYRMFLRWLEKRMIEDGYFDRSRALSELREEWRQSLRVSISTRILGLSKGFSCSPNWINIIREKIFGSDLAIRLTREWIRTRCS